MIKCRIRQGNDNTTESHKQEITLIAAFLRGVEDASFQAAKKVKHPLIPPPPNIMYRWRISCRCATG